MHLWCPLFNYGVASAVSFRFLVPLENSILAWFRWNKGIYVPFTLPAIGEKVTIEGERFKIG